VPDKLTAGQQALLHMMVGGSQWWTTADVRKAWSGSPEHFGVGMALRGLWTRGLAEREHGPPASYRLTAKGRRAARELR
jgi:hypothetical protein